MTTCSLHWPGSGPVLTLSCGEAGKTAAIRAAAAMTHTPAGKAVVLQKHGHWGLQSGSGTMDELRVEMGRQTQWNCQQALTHPGLHSPLGRTYWPLLGIGERSREGKASKLLWVRQC